MLVGTLFPPSNDSLTYCFVYCKSVTMIGENRQLVTDEPVEFEKQPVEVQDFRRITDHFRGIYGIYLKFIQKILRIPTCNRLDLQTLGSQPIIYVFKILPDHWSVTFINILFGRLPTTQAEQCNDRGEPAVSYKWIGWDWKLTGWSLWLQENYRSF